MHPAISTGNDSNKQYEGGREGGRERERDIFQIHVYDTINIHIQLKPYEFRLNERESR